MGRFRALGIPSTWAQARAQEWDEVPNDAEEKKSNDGDDKDPGAPAKLLNGLRGGDSDPGGPCPCDEYKEPDWEKHECCDVVIGGAGEISAQQSMGTSNSAASRAIDAKECLRWTGGVVTPLVWVDERHISSGQYDGNRGAHNRNEPTPTRTLINSCGNDFVAVDTHVHTVRGCNGKRIEKAAPPDISCSAHT